MRQHATTPFAKAVRKADDAVSKMVRAQDGGCVTCQNEIGPFDCGHFRRRECMSTRYSYLNLGKQCRKCNHFESGRPYEFSRHIDRTWGKGTAARLYKTSQKIKRWEVKELEQLTAAAKMGLAVYKQLYDELI